MKRAHARHGYTLVEVAFWLAILAVAMLGLASALVSTHRMRAAASERALAASAAERVLETIKVADFDAVPALYGQGYVFSVSGLVPPPGGPAGAVYLDGANPELLRISVEVRWRGITGPGTVVLDSLVARR